MMDFINVPYDIMRLHLIPFTLKDVAKKWLQSFPTNSIATWDKLVWVFFRKYFPNGMMFKLRN